jgi:hypothetical protein
MDKKPKKPETETELKKKKKKYNPDVIPLLAKTHATTHRTLRGIRK